MSLTSQGNNNGWIRDQSNYYYNILTHESVGSVGSYVITRIYGNVSQLVVCTETTYMM